MRAVRKAVFPVAGLGTRMLPATKAIPKEMLPVVDRPIIERVVEEARQAGIEHFVFVTGRNKSAIEDHFDMQFELDSALSERKNGAALAKLRKDLPEPGKSSFTRQQAALGLGHAIWCAREIIGDEPFAVLLPDVLMKSEQGCLSQLMEIHLSSPGDNVVAVNEVAWQDVHRYGVIGYSVQAGGILAIDAMVEKPASPAAPSNLAISGRYILQPQIFEILSSMPTGLGGEIQLTDAMIKLMAVQKFWALKFSGQTFDCGDRLGFLMANLVFGLDDPAIGDQLALAVGRLCRTNNVTSKSASACHEAAQSPS